MLLRKFVSRFKFSCELLQHPLYFSFFENCISALRKSAPDLKLFVSSSSVLLSFLVDHLTKLSEIKSNFSFDQLVVFDQAFNMIV